MHLGDVVLLDLVSVCTVSSCPSDRLDDDQIRSLCGALAVVRQKSHWIITINVKMNVWTCELIFPTDTLQQKIEITDIWGGGYLLRQQSQCTRSRIPSDAPGHHCILSEEICFHLN